MTLHENPQGNYRFLKGIAPYSSGVVAMPGFEIIRVRMVDPIPVRPSGFDRISRILKDAGRPMEALCAMELRIPEPLSFDGFKDFNLAYQSMLKGRRLLLGDVNPIARTNIAPAVFIPKEPSIHAFSYTALLNESPTKTTFIVAGAGDLRDQSDLSPAAIIRPNEINSEAMQEKASVVMRVMQDRLAGLEAGWEDATDINIYTVSPLHSLLIESILKPIGAAAQEGVHWYYSNPPIKGLAFEMDVRGVAKDLTFRS
ncbi:MAG: RidA family protein [Saprospiraceae bacterium]|nr:RidA family protein [Saprospiraceae bacterium]